MKRKEFNRIRSVDRVRFDGIRRRALRRYPFCSAPAYKRSLDCGTEGTE